MVSNVLKKFGEKKYVLSDIFWLTTTGRKEQLMVVPFVAVQNKDGSVAFKNLSKEQSSVVVDNGADRQAVVSALAESVGVEDVKTAFVKSSLDMIDYVFTENGHTSKTLSTLEKRYAKGMKSNSEFNRKKAFQEFCDSYKISSSEAQEFAEVLLNRRRQVEDAMDKEVKNRLEKMRTHISYSEEEPML